MDASDRRAKHQQADPKKPILFSLSDEKADTGDWLEREMLVDQ